MTKAISPFLFVLLALITDVACGQEEMSSEHRNIGASNRSACDAVAHYTAVMSGSVITYTRNAGCNDAVPAKALRLEASLDNGATREIWHGISQARATALTADLAAQVVSVKLIATYLVGTKQSEREFAAEMR